MLRFLLPFYLLSTPTLADSFLLSSHKDWTVQFVSDSSDYCSATTYFQSAAFSIDISLEEGIRVWIIDQQMSWEKSDNGVLFLWTDKDTPWTIGPVSLGRTVATFVPVSKEAMTTFLAELARGNRVFIDYNLEGGNGPAPDASFSLAGASAAFDALADCYTKLTPAL